MRLIVLLLACAVLAPAHVGSPDVFYESSAGPYRLLVTVRPPQVVPGVAEVEIRAATAGVQRIRVAPVPLTGPGAKLPPVPDVLVRDKDDPQFYTGSVWLMACCSWQVRIYVEGAQGAAELAVPVTSVASRVLRMEKTMGAVLLFFVIFLAVGAVSMIAAYAREARLEAHEQPGDDERRRGRRATVIAAILVATSLWLGKLWWDTEDNQFQRYIYKPLQMTAAESAGHLTLQLEASGWLQRVDDLVPDHGHLMHLFMVRVPEMERMWHLHPDMTEPGKFTQALPDVPAGRYQLYADVVHKSGLPETLVAEFGVAGDIAGRSLEGDDAAGAGPPVSAFDTRRARAPLTGGYQMVWERSAEPIRSGRPAAFQFRVEDPTGKPARDLEMYMGMPGHAAFIKADRATFAHVHPSGTVSMAALALAQLDSPHAAHTARSDAPAVVSFPYALPRPGDYRVFVQIKRAGRVETGVFDVRAE